jgi:DNA polymerase-3 subunit delta
LTVTRLKINYNYNSYEIEVIDIYRSFIKEINTEVKKLYLLYGRESYLLDRGLEEIKSRVVKGLEEINYTVFDKKNIDIIELQNACETLPFGSERKLVVIKDFFGLKTKTKKIESDEVENKNDTGSEILDIINNIYDDTCLLFVSYGDIDRRKKIFKDINKIGSVFEFKKIDKKDLIQWIFRFVKNAGKIIEYDSIEYLIQNMGYLDKNSEANMYSIQNELEKILSFSGDEKTVGLDIIKELVKEPIENDVFKLIDTCLEKDIPNSLKIYSDLLLRGESTYSILGLISWGIKNLTKIKELKEEGLDIKGIASGLKMNEYVVRKNINKCNYINYKTLESALEKCIKCETDMKTGMYTEKSMEKFAAEVLLTELFE